MSLARALSPRLSDLHFRTKRSVRRGKPPPTLTFLSRNSPRFHLLRLPPQLPNSKVVEAVRLDGPVVEIGELSGTEDGDLVFETCITRTLPPALTLEQGLQRITEAVEKMKMDPPAAATGIFRFQVAVPPSPKALNWFCCQPAESSVYPLFFLSKNTDNPTYKSLYLKQSCGVFGIGAAIYFTNTSSFTSAELSSTKRYLLNDSTSIMAYGFMDINFNMESSSMVHEAGSSYFFIPQIELHEYEGVSILAATLAWSDSSLCSFEEAVCSYELSLKQASRYSCPTTEKWHSKGIRSTLGKLNVVADETLSMVYINLLSQGGREVMADIMELREAPCSCQFCISLSPTTAVASNMWDHTSEMCYSTQDCANINTVWASLIIEECSRLGLTYFCVAPGSRSSPLAVAASTHPLITCIACFDERSLAFHAVGYARGSHNPAVVITSSGTAVSNLLPAVVEASQDFVPLLLLTADRPSELQDAGANQAINQVNHFGSFVRFFFSLPAATDQIPARVLLTTLDSAVHWATSSPRGPVHINCPFREPLENSPSKWVPSCLKGLDFWMSNAEPFTKYIQVQHSHACTDTHGQMTEVLNVIQKAKNGLLLIGAIHTEDDIWTALLLAKHLQWPTVPDILSGLRLRKLVSFPELEENFMFIDHLDHALLSDSVRVWLQADVIIQIGSRITSKRISQMLEQCFPCSYIMVDEHPCRHDPSHIVTHRIQSGIVEFADCLLKASSPKKNKKWSSFLQLLNMVVASEISFQISTKYSLTEPEAAQVISETLSYKSALFVGNSMAIRDLDMYGLNWSEGIHSIAATMLYSELPCHWIRVAGNRGASGIDGLLSTAVGFAVGCNRRVLCVMGDVSFLHDTNGLAILNQRKSRKPMTVVVINNHGGAIFSLLPVAERTEPNILKQYFYTSHSVSIHRLCAAHGVKHLLVQTKLELQDALLISQHDEMDCVIEVESSIDANATFHRILRKFASHAANDALSTLLRFSVQDSVCKIHRMDYSLFRIPLRAPSTMTTVDQDSSKFYREGFILSLYLEDGSVGLGEVAPFEIHRENLLDVEQQLRFILHVIKGNMISCFLPLLKGSFSSWIWNNLGVPPSSIFPSVRCGLEMAILNVIAARQSSSLLNILQPQINEGDKSERSSKVKICALMDSNGTPSEVAYAAKTLVEEGFTAIKLKVARRGNPMDDAAVIQEVRKRVGRQIDLRADANRGWTFEEAIQFSSFVKDCDLQYIEEPVQDENDIIKFCEESGLPVALDETIGNIQENTLEKVAKYTHPGIVAVVIKPSVIGGFENAALLARWAQHQGKMAVVSAAFESGLGLSAYIQFSCYLELQNADICKAMKNELVPSIAHGLGTYRWLEEDVTTDPLRIDRDPYSGFVEASVADANRVLQKLQINHSVICRKFTGEQVSLYKLNIDTKGYSCFFKVHEVGQRTSDNIVLFLHGFLGTGEDWITIMKAISGSARCISIDLPCHGGSKLQNHGTTQPSFSIEVVADILYKMINQITPGKVICVGYSMGARIALHMALRFSDKIKGAVLIAGSPGLKDKVARKVRRAKDDSRARSLVAHGLQLFVDTWYAGDLWKSLRGHPHFNQIVTSRLQHDDVWNLAKALSDLSVGRQLPLWEDLKHCKTPLVLIYGEKDTKFKTIAQEMFYEACRGINIHEIVEIPNCGHAAHLENPLPIISALRQFFTKLKTTSFSI
ncbi:protein PHYLLO, chloroplastic isoform X1 [Alnus glutinosa]|uniref:protein PHYLLO, chloroplastic isoform X1 n=2 Tax=Alnus glutinosa TaxID=3517 RepID=UPI002D77283B|nr:protein PHYLLO, chloroplastic isoform X1 [Alnus glutinosa]